MSALATAHLPDTAECSTLCLAVPSVHVFQHPSFLTPQHPLFLPVWLSENRIQ